MVSTAFSEDLNFPRDTNEISMIALFQREVKEISPKFHLQAK